jgi:hypothetical protein
MQTKSFVCAAILAGVMGWAGLAQAQLGAPYGVAYPGMMGAYPPGMMGGGMMAAGAQAPLGQAPGCDVGCSTGVGPGCGVDGCGDDGGCGWCHHLSFFGEFLYLRPRNAEIAYAVPINGNLPQTGFPFEQFQVGPVSIVDPDYSPGFRFGAGFTLGACTQIVTTYSQLDSQTQDSISLAGTGPVLRPLVTPVDDAAADFLDAAASLDTQFKLLDVDFKGLFACDCDYRLAYVVGARYANLEQHFAATYAANGTSAVRAESEFDGGGLKLGLEGERYSTRTQFFVYGKGSASFVGGQFRSRYQFDDVGQPLTIDTSWKAGRVVTILDFEVGLGWRNHCDNLRFSAGYMYSSWLNLVKVNEWIHTVSRNNFVDPSDNYYGLMTFDGLTARVEYLW